MGFAKPGELKKQKAAIVIYVSTKQSITSQLEVELCGFVLT
jgi:hypothetical protein